MNTINMRRVVVTGMGAVTPLGNSLEEVVASLRAQKSGVVFSEDYARAGFKSQIWAPVDEKPLRYEVGRRRLRFAGIGKQLLLGLAAFDRAVCDAKLDREQIAERPDIALIAAQGGPSTQDQCRAWDILNKQGGPKRIGPFAVVPTMNSGLSALIAVDYRLHGISFAISSACASSAHAIGEAAVMIATGRANIAFAGGAEDAHISKAMGFDAMRALSTSFNDKPERASRPFSVGRDGFVEGEGAGFLVLEEYEHALKRGARIYAEVVGYGATSDGYSMVEPSGKGAIHTMVQALTTLGGIPVRGEPLEVNYLNAHGTSTPKGDIKEAEAVARTFGFEVPLISSTKSLTGHALGAAGACEAIYTLLMLHHGFVAGTANLNPDPDLPEMVQKRIVSESREAKLRTVMSNSFGFGGANASVVFTKL